MLVAQSLVFIKRIHISVTLIFFFNKHQQFIAADAIWLTACMLLHRKESKYITDHFVRCGMLKCCSSNVIFFHLFVIFFKWF